MSDAQTIFAREQQGEVMDCRTCNECKHVSNAYVHVDPRNGKIVNDRVWCLACYKSVSASREAKQ